LLQSPIENKKIDSFKVIKVKAGDKIHIPKNTGHLALNTGKTWLVTSDDSPVNFLEKDPVSMPGHADYESVRKMRGFAYYVVEKDGKPDFVKNNEYIDIPEIEFVL
jgi:oxalate decarboxylase/phosphoglucose isomerase-like protein (cupin superfamily)